MLTDELALEILSRLGCRVSRLSRKMGRKPEMKPFKTMYDLLNISGN
jgi:hypothetical protein